MARFCPLFSGSSGNCTYIGSGDGGILIDVGLNAKNILSAMNDRDISENNIQAIFITHAHSDHISALRVLNKRLRVPVFAARETLDFLYQNGHLSSTEEFHDVEKNGAEFEDFSVNFFRTSHDSDGSGGYTIKLNDGQKIAVCTDLGVVTDTVRQAITGCDLVMIESNHDVGMLQNGAYPYYLKQRILSDSGHLSNVCCSVELPNLIKNGTSRFVLGHLSKDNNRQEIAKVSATSSLMDCGAKETIDYILYIAPPMGGKMIYL